MKIENNGFGQFAASAGTAASAVSAGTASSALTASSLLPGGYGYISSYEANPPFISAVARGLNAAFTISDACAFQMPQAGSFSFMRLPMFISTSGGVGAAVTTSDFTAQAAMVHSFNAVVYSLGTGANSQSLQYVTSGQGYWSQAWSLTFTSSGAAGASWTNSCTMQVYAGGGLATLTGSNSVGANSQPNNAFTDINTVMSSQRWLDIPFAASLSAGPYWMVFGYSSSSSGNAGTSAWNPTAQFVRYQSHYIQSAPASYWGQIGQANLTASGLMGYGSFATAGGGTTNSIPISAISSMGGGRLYFQLLRSA